MLVIVRTQLTVKVLAFNEGNQCHDMKSIVQYPN
jgi:hypothetical protein